MNASFSCITSFTQRKLVRVFSFDIATQFDIAMCTHNVYYTSIIPIFSTHCFQQIYWVFIIFSMHQLIQIKIRFVVHIHKVMIRFSFNLVLGPRKSAIKPFGHALFLAWYQFKVICQWKGHKNKKGIPKDIHKAHSLTWDWCYQCDRSVR